MSITYGGGFIRARMAQDVVGVGPLAVKQKFGSTLIARGRFGRSDGIVGLAMPALASAGTTPFMDNLMYSGRLQSNEQLFSIYLSSIQGGSSSEVMFGGINKQRFKGKLKAHHLISTKDYW